ncbi:calcineurin-like phosphoesterase [Thraustotheca clavata]|uniref:Calcineurin-like phosphoesterase n=1 Tax=Thraustotheca clavata TaxID=74557 RepID=A0A1W0A1C0_9STRA|nr:calcineurin-like phosphoesterase [Thraustotheca clavata]
MMLLGLAVVLALVLGACGWIMMQWSVPLAFVLVGFGGMSVWNMLLRAAGVQVVVPLTSARGKDALRVVCVANLNNLHENVNVPLGDVLVVAGGCTRYGRHDEAAAVNAWLGRLPHQFKVVVPAEYERSLDLTTLLPNANVLLDEPMEIQTILFYGASSSTITWKELPRSIDMLITPQPPLGVLDTIFTGHHIGDKELLKAVVSYLRPAYHVFGKAQESYGHKKLGATTFINAATCTAMRQPTNPPIVLDIPKKLIESNPQ